MQEHAHHSLQETSLADWIPFVMIVIVLLVYIVSIRVVTHKKSNWSHWHTLSFTLGLVLIGFATLPALMEWAHQDLRGHMVQHLLIGMYAPLFLVLGAPVTLALKTLPVKAARGVTTFMRSKVFYVLSHPLSAFILNIGGMYALYLTPFYVESLNSPVLHYLIHLHFLTAGYLFTWSMIGLDPAPKRPGLQLKVSVLFLSIAAHAFLSKFMYAYLYPINSPHAEAQIQEAAKLMYYWGDLAELLLVIALFTLWYKKRNLKTNIAASHA